MSPTMWESSYSVGIEQIDVQHKVIVGYIAGLEDSISNPDEHQRWSSIHYAIVKLRDATRIHFAVEECLMEILGYPDLAAHSQEHNGFISYLSELERRSITHNDITENEIVDFLRNWLLNHIVGSDKEYSRHFAKAKERALESGVGP